MIYIWWYLSSVFYGSRPELKEVTVLEIAGTILAAQLAYTYGVARNAADGTPHVHSAMGAGYINFKDLSINASYSMDDTLNKSFIRWVKKVLGVIV